MVAAANHVEEVNNAIASSLSQLMQKLDPLTQTWQGSAASSFQALKARWIEDATKLNQALLGISEKLREAQKGYAASEEASAQSFSQITNRLG
jgi:WXG100 family type VII secretion target